MNDKDLEIEKPKISTKTELINSVKHILCLILPVAFAFGGYFLSPVLWTLLNKTGIIPEYFKFICAIISFLLPSIFIFIETRKLNPIIKITITEKKD